MVVQYLHKGIALHTILGDDSLEKDEGVASHAFYWWLCGFLYKARWQMRAHLKQVANEACNMITMSSFKLAKFVNEENQQG